ncbi:MAG TPA: hypothetical protein VF748_00795 [Candidatus Acidoferrum sp.]
MITVIDVFRDLQLEPIPEQTWAAGNRVRDRYLELYGVLPTKELRTKTYDGGTHCFAVYPLSFRPVIERIVNDIATEAARQMDLFGPPAAHPNPR